MEIYTEIVHAVYRVYRLANNTLIRHKLYIIQYLEGNQNYKSESYLAASTPRSIKTTGTSESVCHV